MKIIKRGVLSSLLCLGILGVSHSVFASAGTADVLPTSFTFQPPVIVGQTSFAQPFTVTATSGNTKMDATSATISDTTNLVLDSSNCDGVTLKTNSTPTSCQVTVACKPTTEGDHAADLTFFSNGTINVNPVQIHCPGVVAPAATLTPPDGSTVFFGTVSLGSNQLETVTLTNDGSATLNVTNIAVSGSSDYAITGGTCPSVFPFTVDPVTNNNCTVEVTFTPTNPTLAIAGTLTFTDDAGNVQDATQSVNLSGDGIAPVASLAATDVPFNNVGVGGTKTLTVQLNNTGTGTLTISGIAVTGGEFSQNVGSTTCGATLAAGSNCLIAINFSPTATGQQTGLLTVTDDNLNVPGSTQTANLTGNGIPAGVPSIDLSPAAGLTFDPTLLLVQTPSQAITIANNGFDVNAGDADLHVTNITVGADFSIVGGTCSGTTFTLSAQTSCTVDVVFKPTVKGLLSEPFTATSDTGGVQNTQTSVVLNGTGLVSGEDATVSPTSINFGTQTVGGTSAPQTITLTNFGDTTLNIASVAKSGNNANEFGITNNCGATLASAQSCTIISTFSPTSAGGKSASVDITDDVGTQSVALTGTATVTPPPAANLTLTKTIDNSDITCGSPVNYTLTVKNTGNANATGVTVVDLVPNGMTINSIATNPSSVTCDQATLTCSIGTLASGASVTITINATPGVSGQLQNVAKATSTNAGTVTAQANLNSQDPCPTPPSPGGSSCALSPNATVGSSMSFLIMFASIALLGLLKRRQA